MLKKIKHFLKKINSFRYIKLVYILFVLIILVVTFYLLTSYGKYIYNPIRSAYLSSKNFYFNCDKMTTNNAIYQLNNWSGADSYTLIFNMNSFKNNLVASSSDIAYNISINCTSNITCSASKNSGVIYSQTNTDYFTVTINPAVAFNDGDTAILNVSASSVSPYIETLYARFTLKVGTAGISYLIQDSVNSPVIEVRITNTLDYYEVRTAFDTYSVGDRIDIDTYQQLPSSSQEKCASTIITLDFDPNDVVLDMTTSTYLKGYNFQNESANGIDFIGAYSFKMDALSSERITFYKKNVSSNYTYPIITDTPIVSVVGS